MFSKCGLFKYYLLIVLNMNDEQKIFQHNIKMIKSFLREKVTEIVEDFG